MRHCRRSPRSVAILNDPEIPRLDEGGLALCLGCQRRMWFAGGFLMFMSEELRRTAKGSGSLPFYRTVTARTCRACKGPLPDPETRAPREPNPQKKRTGRPIGAPRKHLDGANDLCEACETEARIGATARSGRSDFAVEHMLTKKLRRAASMAEPSPKLVGSVSPEEAAAMDEDAAWRRVRQMRWPDRGGEPRCPKCASEKSYTYAERRVFRCASCKHTFSAVSGTTFAGFKGGYAALLRRMAYEGKIDGSDVMEIKTALDMRRRKQANDRR